MIKNPQRRSTGDLQAVKKVCKNETHVSLVAVVLSESTGNASPMSKQVLPLVSACTIGRQATFILHLARNRGCKMFGRTSLENQSTELVLDRCSKSP